ncbi:MAG TPA: hypothetical protein VHJ40_08785 [Actinomycetota bacterium]|nr:hypothetical protein [Actinomycetota bacterium]
MKVESLVIANYATTDKWLLRVEGGGWEHCKPQILPTTVRGYVAGIFTLDRDELGTTPAVLVEIGDKNGHVEEFKASTIVNGMRPAATPGVPSRVPFAIPFTTVARAPTVMKVRLLNEGDELATTSFAVLDPVPDAPTGL